MKPIDSRIQQILDNIEVYQSLALQDYGVPAWQALPVASRPDIAFRPACGQLEPIWQADGSTAWVWEGQTIYSTPGQATGTPETLLNLQGAGVCITGSHAVDVPLVPTDEVFSRFQAQVEQQTQPRPVALPGESPVSQATQPTATTTEAPTTAGFPVLPVLGLVVVCVALGLAFPHLIRAWDGLGARLVRGKGREKPAAQAAPAQPKEEDFELEL